MVRQPHQSSSRRWRAAIGLVVLIVIGVFGFFKESNMVVEVKKEGGGQLNNNRTKIVTGSTTLKQPNLRSGDSVDGNKAHSTDSATETKQSKTAIHDNSSSETAESGNQKSKSKNTSDKPSQSTSASSSSNANAVSSNGLEESSKTAAVSTTTNAKDHTQSWLTSASSAGNGNVDSNSETPPPDEESKLSADYKSEVQWDGPVSVGMAQYMSSVDFFATSGLGHRMNEMGDANVVAKMRGFGLRIYWGTCPRKSQKPIEVFEFFFGPQPLNELVNVRSYGQALKIVNEPEGFVPLNRTGFNLTSSCPCSNRIIEIHNQFYTSLRDERFRFRQEVQDFVHQHFDNHTVIGLHVRAGNGEKGNFAEEGRAIPDLTGWVQNVAQHLKKLSEDFPNPPRLFVATDTPTIITSLRKELEHSKIDVLDYGQVRPPEGSGVIFNERGQNMMHDACVVHWKNALMDMMILSHVDVLIAGRSSSFTQSLPLTVALSKPMSQRQIPYTYCEMNPSGSATQCYQDFREWCCTGKTSFHLEGIRGSEFKRIPYRLDRVNFSVRKRTTHPKPSLATCFAHTICFLPYHWNT